MNTFNLTLDLNKSRAANPVRIRQGDVQGTTITALILDHGATADLTGYTAQFVMDLPDGTHYYRKAASISGNTVTVTIDEAQAASVTGTTTLAYVQFLRGSTVKASTGCVTVEVLPDALDGKTLPESYDSAIQDAIDALGDAVQQLPDMVEDVLTAHPEWTTTVQDGSITKAKLATDLALDRERLMYRLANMLTAQLPEGETATATDAARTPMAGLALYGRSTQDGTPTPSAPVPIVSVGAANLLPNAASALTASGLTFTVNADGSVHVSGTATATVAYDYLGTNVHNVTLAAGTYTLSGCPSGGSGSKWKLDINDTNDAYTNDFGSGTTFNVASTRTIRRCRIVVYSGQTVDFTFKPMLNAGSTAYPYVPYGHAGLWARGRNLLNPAQVFSGVTYYTVNADGTLTVTAEDSRGWASLPVAPLAAGMYTISISGNDGGRVSYHVVDGSAETALGIIGSGSDTFTLTSGGGVKIKVHQGTFPRTVRIQVQADTTATAYQPYTYTVTPIDLDGHELRSLPDGTRDELTVDERGHAVLVQRVGEFTITQDLANAAYSYANLGTYSRAVMWVASVTMPQAAEARDGGGWCTMAPWVASYTADSIHAYATTSSSNSVVTVFGTGSTAAEVATKYVGAKLYYPLATPVTHDLGTIDPVPLVGPDLTAQAIPTAPFALTYERDLNVTLARLESAIATLA